MTSKVASAMTTPTLTSDARRNVVLFLNGALDGHRGRTTYSQGEDGQKVVEFVDVPVFRSGTFRDSMGIQHTWESIHLKEMVMHFDHLREAGVFASVPVRQGHPSFFGPDPIHGLIGWHTGLRTEDRVNPIDNQTYTYLLASYRIIDPIAAAKIEAGLFVNRSAEVGTFLTNSEAEYWPVYQGFAYVDIPAVEGLNSFQKFAGSAPVVGETFSIMDSGEQEAPVTGAQENAPKPTPPATPAAQPATTAQAPAEPVGGTPSVPADGTSVEATQAGDVASAPVTESSQHGKTGVAFQFTIGGQTTSDFAAVQRHITTLETAQREAREFARMSFVESLAQGPTAKVTAPQLESLKEFAKGLSDEQYTQWKASWEVAPAVPLLALHGRGTGTNGGTPAQQQAPIDQEIADLEQIVKHHKDGGVMSQQQIESLASYKRLQTLLAQRAGTGA